MENQVIADDIQYIRQMIQNNRRVLIDNGVAYISAGIYQLIGTISSILLQAAGKGQFIPHMWMSFMAILIAVNLYYGLHSKQSKSRNTFAAKLFGVTWIACLIPILITCIVFFVFSSITITAFFIIITAVMGIGYYITGSINELTIMKVFAFGWWFSSLIAALWTRFAKEYQLVLFLSILFTLFELIPGTIIYLKWKKIYND
ncbi:MAG: hypothetical protein LWX56_04150 [Ignavibacteria bacterium]|nr:hypothetical protein [Ignavibacteria bacterium]